MTTCRSDENSTATRGLPWRREETAFIFLLAALCILYVHPLLAGGVWFISHEMQHALVRLSEFHAAITGGRFPVRWADNLMAGHGYPLFNFFPPLSFLLAEIFHLAGATLHDAWKLEVILVRFAGVAGMYAFLRQPAGRLGAVAGSLLFLSAPYHASTLYVRGNLQEFTALSLWPLAFWGVRGVARLGTSWWKVPVPLAALAIGLLATSHVLTAYMASFHLLAFGLLLLVHAAVIRTPFDFLSVGKDIGIAALTCALGAGLAAFFLIPAVMEINQTQSALLTEWTQYKDHFLTPLQIIKPTWGYGLSLPGPEDTMPLHVGIGIMAFSLLSIALLPRLMRTGRAAFPIVALLLFALTCFGMTAYSAPLWNIWPRAAFLQFPWRLLIPATFWGCTFIAVTLGRTILSSDRPRGPSFRLVFLAACAAPFLLIAPRLHPLLYDLETPDYSPQMLRRVMTNTMTGEYLPESVGQWPTRRSLRAVYPGDWERPVPVEGQGSADYITLLDTEESTDVWFDVFHYPGWTVRIDGKRTPSYPVPPHGLIGWTMPAGEHGVEITFGETPLRRLADIISLISMMIIGSWLAVRCMFCSQGLKNGSG